MSPRCYLTQQVITTLQCRAAGLGLILGVLATLSLTTLKPREADAAMERACTWPRDEGEATMAWIEEGKFKCWKFR